MMIMKCQFHWWRKPEYLEEITGLYVKFKHDITFCIFPLQDILPRKYLGQGSGVQTPRTSPKFFKVNPDTLCERMVATIIQPFTPNSYYL